MSRFDNRLTALTFFQTHIDLRILRPLFCWPYSSVDCRSRRGAQLHDTATAQHRNPLQLLAPTSGTNSHHPLRLLAHSFVGFQKPLSRFSGAKRHAQVNRPWVKNNESHPRSANKFCQRQLYFLVFGFFESTLPDVRHLRPMTLRQMRKFMLDLIRCQREIEVPGWIVEQKYRSFVVRARWIQRVGSVDNSIGNLRTHSAAVNITEGTALLPRSLFSIHR